MSEYSSTDARIDWFAGQDGTRLCLHIIGEGRPLVLLHGLFSSAFVNWINFGTAAHLAKAGFQVFMPDLRAHGAIAAPHDPAAYPSALLVQDALALMSHLNLSDFHIGGFSLGALKVPKLLLVVLTTSRSHLQGA